jgi:UDP-N-acetylglucosamine 2-epimerase
MQNILVVFGTRPEAVKMAPVVLELRKHVARYRTYVCVTGQHRQLLDPVLSVFGIEADFDLNVMAPNQTLTGVTTRMMNGLDRVFAEAMPDLALVQGDTATTIATALVAFHRRVPLGHVEAGLRTLDKYKPYPEEVYRRMTSVVCDLHFAPTEDARRNLLREGVPAEQVAVTGNTVVDALHYVLSLPKDGIQSLLQDGVLSLPKADERLVLVTVHRRESFGEPFEQICLALRDLALRYPDHQFVYPVHLNPNVQQPVHRILRGLPNFRLLPPQDYLAFVALMQRADLILTDSGGVQEEGSALHKPVLVLREVTERPEGVHAGAVKLVGVERPAIVREAVRLLDDPGLRARMAAAPNPFGDGRAAQRIIEFITSWFGGVETDDFVAQQTA